MLPLIVNHLGMVWKSLQIHFGCQNCSYMNIREMIYSCGSPLIYMSYIYVCVLYIYMYYIYTHMYMFIQYIGIWYIIKYNVIYKNQALGPPVATCLTCRLPPEQGPHFEVRSEKPRAFRLLWPQCWKNHRMWIHDMIYKITIFNREIHYFYGH